MTGENVPTSLSTFHPSRVSPQLQEKESFSMEREISFDMSKAFYILKSFSVLK